MLMVYGNNCSKKCQPMAFCEYSSQPHCNPAQNGNDLSVSQGVMDNNDTMMHIKLSHSNTDLEKYTVGVSEQNEVYLKIV